MSDVYIPAELKKVWWLLLVMGAASVVLGGLLIFWPGKTVTVVAIVIGLYMLVFGVIRFVVALFDANMEARWFQAFLGVVGVVLGFVVMRQPEGAIGLIVLLTGLFWLIGGLVDLFRAFGDRTLPDRGLRIALALLSVVAGVIVLLWPAATFFVLAIVAGVWFVIGGIMEIMAAFQVKNATAV